MYKFHYEEIMCKYGSRAKLAYTDTDSFIYHIQTPDLYRDMADNLDVYDASDYPATTPPLKDECQDPRQDEGRMLEFGTARICQTTSQNAQYPPPQW